MDELFNVVSKKIYYKANVADINRKYVASHLRRLIQTEDAKELEEIMGKMKLGPHSQVKILLDEIKSIIYGVYGGMADFFNRTLDAPIKKYYSLAERREEGDIKGWLKAFQDADVNLHDIIFRRYFLRELLGQTREILGMEPLSDSSESKELMEKTYLEIWKAEVDFAILLSMEKRFVSAILGGVEGDSVIEKWSQIHIDTTRELTAGNLDPSKSQVLRAKSIAIDKFMNRVKNLYHKVISWTLIKKDWEGKPESAEMMEQLEGQFAKWKNSVLLSPLPREDKDPYAIDYRRDNFIQYMPVNWDKMALSPSGKLREVLKEQAEIKAIWTDLVEKEIRGSLKKALLSTGQTYIQMGGRGLWENAPGRAVLPEDEKSEYELMIKISKLLGMKIL